MTVIELKEKLIAKINTIDDEVLLDNLSRTIEQEEAFNEIYVLSPEESSAVKEGIEQIENGMFYTNDEADMIFNKCLGK